MTRKELVEALEANFKPEEVVTFEYCDGDYGITTETDVAVKEHTELANSRVTKKVLYIGG